MDLGRPGNREALHLKEGAPGGEDWLVLATQGPGGAAGI